MKVVPRAFLWQKYAQADDNPFYKSLRTALIVDVKGLDLTKVDQSPVPMQFPRPEGTLFDIDGYGGIFAESEAYKSLGLSTAILVANRSDGLVAGQVIATYHWGRQELGIMHPDSEYLDQVNDKLKQSIVFTMKLAMYISAFGGAFEWKLLRARDRPVNLKGLAWKYVSLDLTRRN